jgi:hypothetical protein
MPLTLKQNHQTDRSALDAAIFIAVATLKSWL